MSSGTTHTYQLLQKSLFSHGEALCHQGVPPTPFITHSQTGPRLNQSLRRPIGSYTKCRVVRYGACYRRTWGPMGRRRKGEGHRPTGTEVWLDRTVPGRQQCRPHNRHRRHNPELHQIPSGLPTPHCNLVLGDGMVIDPWVLEKELDSWRELTGERPEESRLFISERASVILPFHRMYDSTDKVVGTTGRGIGPAYRDRIERVGIRFADIEGILKTRERCWRSRSE